jgi:hypothetical protein
MIEQDQRRGVARPHVRRFAQARLALQRLHQFRRDRAIQGASFSTPPNPCMRRAH